jgi:hypothetical protein
LICRTTSAIWQQQLSPKAVFLPITFIEFRVDQWAKLVGLDVAAGTAKSGKFFFTVFSSKPGNFKACGDSDTILEHSTGQCLRVSPEIWLRPGCYFSIQFTFPLISNRSGLPRENYHHALRELTSTNGCPKVTLTGGMDVLFPIRSLVFDGPKVS